MAPTDGGRWSEASECKEGQGVRIGGDPKLRNMGTNAVRICAYSFPKAAARTIACHYTEEAMRLFACHNPGQLPNDPSWTIDAPLPRPLGPLLSSEENKTLGSPGLSTTRLSAQLPTSLGGDYMPRGWIK